MKNQADIFVIILRNLSQEELNQLNSLAETKSLVVQSNGFDLTTIQNSTEGNRFKLDQLYKDSYEDAFKQILNSGEIELENQKGLAEHLKDRDGYSLWYYVRFMALYKLRSKIYDHRLSIQIEKVKNEFKEVHVFHTSAKLDNIEGVESHRSSIKKKNATLINGIIYLITFKLRTLFGFFQIFKLFGSKKYILLSNAQPNQKVIRKSDLKEIRGDHFAEYFQEEIQSEKEFLNVSEFFPPNLKSEYKLGLKKEVLFARFKNVLNLEFILFIQLFNPWFYIRAIKGIVHVKKMYSDLHLKKNVSVEEEFIIPVLQTFKRLSLFLAVRKAALKWLFKIKKISYVGGTNEHDPRVKSILESAGALGIKTFGIQHGVIHPRHMHYCFTKEDMDYKPNPDVTFLWGDYWKNTLLTASNYSEANLEVVGQIRSDIINRLLQVPKSDLIQSLDSSKKTILYPSQPLYVGEEEMRKNLAKDFLRLSKEFPDLQFIIKPHPKELDCEEFMSDIAKELGTANYQVLRGDLYKTIAASDLVVVYNSTVGAESIYFKKPLLVMDYSNNDFSGFIASGIGIEILNYQALATKLKRFIAAEELVNNDAMKMFVKDRAFTIDGKVSQRIVDYLKAR